MQLLSPDVWFLAHPIAPDKHYRLIDNLTHIEKLARLCFRTGVMVIAPYYLTCLVLDDGMPSDRELGTRTNDHVITKLQCIITAGHRISSGVDRELQLIPNGAWIDMTGVPDSEFSRTLEEKMRTLDDAKSLV